MFSELHKLFDRFLGIHIQDRYPYIEIQNQPYRFDRLAPETGQGADEEGEQQETPIDLSDTEEDEGNFQGTTLQLYVKYLMYFLSECSERGGLIPRATRLGGVHCRNKSTYLWNFQGWICSYSGPPS